MAKEPKIKEFGKTEPLPEPKKPAKVKGWPPQVQPETTYTAPAEEYDTKVITPTTEKKDEKKGWGESD